MTTGTDDRAHDDEVIRDGNVVIDERMNRRDGLVEYAGTTDERDPMADRDIGNHGPGAMQAGSTVLAGTASESDRPGSTEQGGPSDMTVDNTTPGLGNELPSNQLLSRITEGMKVVDANGDEVGKVEYLRMGDPQAVTQEGQVYQGDNTLIDDAARAFGADPEPDVPDPFRSELLREGFVKVDGPGWFGADRYLRAADIADVANDTVRLRVAKEALPSDKT